MVFQSVVDLSAAWFAGPWRAIHTQTKSNLYDRSRYKPFVLSWLVRIAWFYITFTLVCVCKFLALHCPDNKWWKVWFVTQQNKPWSITWNIHIFQSSHGLQYHTTQPYTGPLRGISSFSRILVTAQISITILSEIYVLPLLPHILDYYNKPKWPVLGHWLRQNRWTSEFLFVWSLQQPTTEY